MLGIENFLHAPHGGTLQGTSIYLYYLYFQGGGVQISGGSVTFSGCDIYENTAESVSASPFPDISSIAPMEESSRTFQAVFLSGRAEGSGLMEEMLPLPTATYTRMMRIV